MNESFPSIIAHLQNEIARGTFPSAQFVIGQSGQPIAEGALGYAVLEPEEIPATPNTIYDLASLTKPLVTTLLTMIFAERGRCDLAAPASDYLQELRNTDKRDITLLQLLTHTSGLQAWRPLYLEARSRNEVVRAIAHSRRAPAGDTKSPPVALYSDLNFILLGFLLERLTSERLDRVAQREIVAPLGLTNTMFNPPPEWQRKIAATEQGQTHERRTVAEMKFLCPLPEPDDLAKDLQDAEPGSGHEAGKPAASAPAVRRPLRRKHLLWGEVHDGNAYFMEGVSGHAGLFSTAREVFALASQFIGGSRLLQNRSLALFPHNYTPGSGEARSAGWMLAATKDCAAGSSLPPEAFGHNGFTGTSVWVDGASERIFVLLTNRVHPQARDLGVKQARQQFHTLAVEALNQYDNESV